MNQLFHLSRLLMAQAESVHWGGGAGIQVMLPNVFLDVPEELMGHQLNPLDSKEDGRKAAILLGSIQRCPSGESHPQCPPRTNSGLP